MILTVTMNPAIDKTLVIDDFRINHVNRVNKIQIDAAGKGINVSKVIKKLGGRTKTFAFLGGENGNFIERELLKSRVTLVSIRVESETRVNTKIVDYKNNTFTDVNEKGGLVSEKCLTQFSNALRNHVTSQSVVVFTGSVPPGVPLTIYGDLIKKYNEIGATTVLDADGELFVEGLKAKPNVIKPNIHELESYLNRKLDDEKSIIEAGKKFIELGVELVIISLGEKGALFITSDHIYRGSGIKVDVKATVGAGDSMLAGICYGLHKNIPLEKTIALAIATSAAKVMTPGTQPAELSLIQKLTKQVIIEEIGEQK